MNRILCSNAEPIMGPSARDKEVAWEHYDTLCDDAQLGEHERIVATYRAEIEAAARATRTKVLAMIADVLAEMERESSTGRHYAEQIRAALGRDKGGELREQIERETRAKAEAEIIAYLGKVADEEEAHHTPASECIADALRIEAGNISGGEHRRGGT